MVGHNHLKLIKMRADIKRNPPWTCLFKTSHSMPELNSVSTLKTWPSEQNNLIHLSWIDRPESSDEGLFRPG